LVRKFRNAITAGGDATAIGAKMYDALRGGKKAEFALDILEVTEFGNVAVPRYIAEGLEWLLHQLKKKQVEVLPQQRQKACQTKQREQVQA